jgi:methyl-accepting chemotaxis protein
MLRASLAAKAVIFIALLVAVTAAGVVAAAYWVLSHELDAKAHADIETSLRILALTYEETYRDVKITLDDGKVVRVEAPAMPNFADNAVVDRTAALIGGNATVFAFDAARDQFVRRTTNVKNENGERAAGTELAPDHPGQAQIRRGEAYRGRAILFGRSYFTAYQPIFAPDGKLIGILYVGTPIEQYDNMLAHAIISMTIVSGLGALLVAMLTTFLVRRSLKPLHLVAQSMTELAEGNLDAEVGETDRRDEIGTLARVLAVFRAALRHARELETEKTVAKTREAAARKAAMRNLAAAFEQAVGQIVATVSDTAATLEATARTVIETSETTQQLSGAVADASEQASANVQSVATATDQMKSTDDEISRQTQESRRIATIAVAQAEKTDVRMVELSRAAQRIGAVVRLIADVAAQTNLLALNATIEAARAGEAGKGFAVVAEEVKVLAAQTARAAEEIAAQISAMQAATADSVAEIKEIGTTIGRIAEISSTIAVATEEQIAATEEIARNVRNAAQRTIQVAENIKIVSCGATATRTALAQMHAETRSLSRQSHELRLEVERFLATVRAG